MACSSRSASTLRGPTHNNNNNNHDNVYGAVIVTFRDATSWLRAYAECCLLRIVTVVSVTANFLLIYCDVYVCLVLNSGSF